MKRGLLLIDDEPNIVSALTRLLRRDGYSIYSTSSCFEALDILSKEEIGVVIADQRMPEMSGTEFLEQAKSIKPNTIRIVLSGYTELNSVTQAINRGAVYKFLIKPWEDDVLRDQVREAFRQYELQAENERLTAELKLANAELSRINEDLERRVGQKTQEVLSKIQILRVAQEILDALPIGVVGIAQDGLIVTANQSAVEILGDTLAIGQYASDVMSSELMIPIEGSMKESALSIRGRCIHVRYARLGERSRGQGTVILLIPDT